MMLRVRVYMVMLGAVALLLGARLSHSTIFRLSGTGEHVIYYKFIRLVAVVIYIPADYGPGDVYSLYLAGALYYQ